MLSPSTVKRLEAETAAYEDKYLVTGKISISGYKVSKENWDKIFKKDAKNVA